MVLILLAAALVFAWRRRRRSEEEPPHRIVRIAFASAGFAGAISSWLLVDQLIQYPAELELLAITALALIIYALTGLALFGIADFWLGLLRPRRSPGWFFAAILFFVLLIVAAAAAALAIGGVPEELLHMETLQLAVVGAIAGILWWSYLPQPRADVVRRFD